MNILILHIRDPRLSKVQKLAEGQMVNQEIKLRLLFLQSLYFCHYTTLTMDNRFSRFWNSTP